MDPKEIKEALDNGLAAIKDEQAKLTKAQADVDGHVLKIQSDLESQGSEFSESKDAFQKQVDQVSKLEDSLSTLKADHEALVKKSNQLPGGADYAKSIGDVVAESEAAKNYKGGNAVIAEFAGSFFTKAVTSDSASAGDLTQPYRPQEIIGVPDTTLTVRDLLPIIPIQENSVEYMKEKLFTNSAASQDGENTVKAQSDITFEKASAPVQTIAHWIAMSRQILADAKALRAFVEQKMRYGLKLEEEQQLLLGDGANSNLNGLVPAATAYDNTLNVTGDTAVDKMRHAILQATLAKYPVTGIVLNPAEWEAIELTKTDDKAYLFTNPQNGAQPRLWGKPIVESLSMTADNFLLGAFSMGATIYDREDVTVRVAEQHDDFFVKNMVAMLVEERLALTIERAASFITGTVSTA